MPSLAEMFIAKNSIVLTKSRTLKRIVPLFSKVHILIVLYTFGALAGGGYIRGWGEYALPTTVVLIAVTGSHPDSAVHVRSPRHRL